MEVDTRVAQWDVKLASTGSVRVTSPAPRNVWNELLQADREALVFQSPAWTDALIASGGYADASRLYEFSGGRKLVLPMVRRKDRQDNADQVGHRDQTASVSPCGRQKPVHRIRQVQLCDIRQKGSGGNHG